jgi:hypothetical protein
MAKGYNSLADVVATTADGVQLDDIWAEFQQTIELRNSARTALAALFTYNTTLNSDLVAQTASGSEFEESSEYGVPQSLRTAPEMVRVGYPFKFYDLAARYTWRFLAEASAAQVATVHAQALEADNKLVFRNVMRALFNNTSPGVNEDGTPIQPLWNGDGTVPPPFANNTFAGVHSHYMTTGSATFDPQDLEDLIGTVEHHGYGLRTNGDRIVVLADQFQAKRIASFRRGDAGGASYDFIPANDAPAFITDESIVGSRPPGEFNGLRVIGSYGDAWIVQHEYVPTNYVVAVATGGAGSERNPLAFREHKRSELRGFKQIAGGGTYPLVDSYYVRGFGVGVRHRGGAAVMQVTTSATYTAPVIS